LRPLSIRDFALLWTGLTVSLLGDGIYLVAIAWQVYDLSNTPTALSIVGLAWTLPMVLFLLIGGVLSDRFDRRLVLIAADVLRFVAITAIGLLSLTSSIELWHLIALVAVYGVGEALFGPAFGAIVPDLVPQELLLEANSLEQFVRPMAWRLVGPALGGFLIHVFDVGTAFLIDASTFAVSAGCLLAMRSIPRTTDRTGQGSMWREIKQGFGFVRSQTWLWATLGAASVSLLFFWGPLEVLLPFIVRNKLDGGADDLGLVFAFGGAGSVIAAGAMAQLGLPRKHVAFMYSCWALAVALVGTYALAATLEQAMIISFLEAGLASAGLVVWGTMMHRLVPSELQGRVHSADWLVSIGLVPLSFGLTGPIAGALGSEATLLGAGLLGSIATIGFMFVPGLYRTQRDGSMHPEIVEPANEMGEG
jgi:DHA3 family tetracycline resistance protein-like MFS transporter